MRCLIICMFLLPFTDSFYDTFHPTADIMYFCQMMAVLEVINPLLGLVKTGFFPAMIQVIQSLISALPRRPFSKINVQTVINIVINVIFTQCFH